jgi:radical SAM protein with 4Fe4S-binding SPASM domain
MGKQLVVIQNSSDHAKPPRPRARGTHTALIENRRIRLHPAGERPWEGTSDDHRNRINVEKHDSAYVVYKPSTGALSAFNERDFVAFNVFIHTGGDRGALVRYFAELGAAEDEAEMLAGQFATRCITAGWIRTERPEPSFEYLQCLYLTVTRYCDRTCPYCYQGLNDRTNTDMAFEQIRLVVDRVKKVNPRCRFVIAGGEPFAHKRIRDILQLINDEGFTFAILSNGTYVDVDTARFLKGLSGLLSIQISLDGASAETHELTRGKGHFKIVMQAIRNVIDEGVPFIIAPTVHNKNMHELSTVAELAVGNGGWLSPNALKELPHAGLNYTDLALSPDLLQESLRKMNDHLVAMFGLDRIVELAQRFRRGDPEVCSATQPNATHICGMAHSLVDIDWNGDVYPCHLSKGPELVIGNIFREDFPQIFQRVADKQIRVKSHEIEQCSGCKFNSTCAGGCRAGAWFNYGTFEHHDELCDRNYAFQLEKLLIGATMQRSLPTEHHHS